jgi:hypothetical protein
MRDKSDVPTTTGTHPWKGGRFKVVPVTDIAKVPPSTGILMRMRSYLTYMKELVHTSQTVLSNNSYVYHIETKDTEVHHTKR